MHIRLRPYFSVALAAALTLIMVPAQADEAGLSPDSQWMLRGGLDLGRDHARGVAASVDYSGHTAVMPADERYYDAGFAFSRSQSTVKSTQQRPGAETRTGAGNGYVSYGTERWRGVLGLDAASDSYLRKSRRVTLGVDFAQKGFSANLSGSHRKTEFDTFTLDSTTAEDLGISGNAGCTVTDKGVGGRVGYDGSAWGAYATGNSYSFDKVKCAFDSAVPDVLQQLAPADFFDLAGRFLDRARARVGGRIGESSRLLKSEFGLGASLDFWIHWSVDYLRSKDAFGEASTSSYSLTGTFNLAPNVSLDVMLGSTSGDGGSLPFAGVMLAVAM